MPEELHSLCDLIQSIDNQNQLQGKIDSLRETSCPPLEGGEFMDGRRETSPDSSEFPRPLWERVRVRGVSKNNNKLLIIDWIVSHTLTMTKNFANNAILRGLNNCSPQNDYKNCEAHWKNSRKIAFTLAETLITLGIIGVVATLTLPMVIANYNKKVYSTRLKSFYTSMSQAILTSESVNGPKEYWGVEANNDEKMLDVFNTYITPYLNLISKPTKRKRSFTMTNGVVVRLWSGSCTDLYADLNGAKKPNKVGVDIYYFTICTFYKPPLEPYLYNTGLYSRSQLLDKCKTNPAFCSSLLFYDEWEYKNDYPYKLR